MPPSLELSRPFTECHDLLRNYNERIVRVPLTVDRERTNLLKSILNGDKQEVETISESFVDMTTFTVGEGSCEETGNRWHPATLCERVEALENSEELRMIYSHPQWQEFLGVLYRARATPQNAFDAASLEIQVRNWCINHPQISQMLAWFHHCTARYGLAYDPFQDLPISKLLLAAQNQSDPASADLLSEQTEATTEIEVNEGTQLQGGSDSPHVDSTSALTWEQQQYLYHCQQQPPHQTYYCVQGPLAYPVYPAYTAYPHAYSEQYY
jgi:hypothetical protein